MINDVWQRPNIPHKKWQDPSYLFSLVLLCARCQLWKMNAWPDQKCHNMPKANCSVGKESCNSPHITVSPQKLTSFPLPKLISKLATGPLTAFHPLIILPFYHNATFFFFFNLVVPALMITHLQNLHTHPPPLSTYDWLFLMEFLCSVKIKKKINSVKDVDLYAVCQEWPYKIVPQANTHLWIILN